jgi:hypothetical protein
MNLKVVHTFDAPVDVVMRARDERFNHIDKIPGLKKPDITERKETGDTVTTRREFKADADVPGPVKKMLSAEMFHFTEIMTLYKSENKLEWNIVPKAQQDKLLWKGVSRYTDKGGKTERVIDAVVKVKIPFIGDLMEKTIASGFKSSMDKDHKTISAMIDLIKNGEV